MRIRIVTPAPPRSRAGNRMTALRWRRLLRELGHEVEIVEPDGTVDADLLIAIHARSSHPSVRRYRERSPDGPLVVGLAGTDIYTDLAAAGPHTPDASVSEARRELVLDSLSRADHLVALQPLARAVIPAEFRDKVTVILQSARPLGHPPPRSRRIIDVVVVGHLRPVKDPFLPAEALRSIPVRSRIRIVHLGAALDEEMLSRARAHVREDHRYRWLGEIAHGRVRQWIARSHALLHPSRAEGGANTVGEALVLGTPVLASAIPGNLGILGDDHPGVFPVGDAEALAALLRRFEAEPEFRERLEARTATLAERHTPEAEREAWRELIARCS